LDAYHSSMTRTEHYVDTQFQFSGKDLDAGARSFEKTEVGPDDIRIFLTGNETTGSQTLPVINPSSSLGGEINDIEFSTPVDDLRIFAHLGGDDMEDGVVDYRAVDIANLAIRPTATIDGGGSATTNFAAGTGALVSPNLTVSEDPPSVAASFALARDFSSPTVSAATDQTDPGLTFSATPVESPENDLIADAPSAAPGILRVWARRTVTASAKLRNQDKGTVTLSGEVTAGGVS